MKQLNLSLNFDFNDINSGKEFFKKEAVNQEITIFNEPLPTSEELLIDGDMILSIVRESIPYLISIILLWLGKGKRVSVKVKNSKLELKNIKESEARKLLKDFFDKI